MNIGFYAGSFDPFTIGHLQIVKKASEIFDRVIVGIGVNEKKSRIFDKERIKDAINAVFMRDGLKNCECIIYSGLTVDEVLKRRANYLVRGLRNDSDYMVEENLALVNEKLSGLDTIFFRASELSYVSSTLVRELLIHGKDVSMYLPKEIFELLDKE